MASLQNTIINFAQAASQAQTQMQNSSNPMIISLFEFQYQLNIDIKTNLDFSAQFNEGQGSQGAAFHDSAAAGADGGVATDRNIALMIHCVMQPPTLTQAAAATPSTANALSNEAQASIQQASTGGSSGGQGM